MTARRGARYRAVSPEGKRHPFRRSLGAAVRDAVYQLTGWGTWDADGYMLSITCEAALGQSEAVIQKGWTFEVIP